MLNSLTVFITPQSPMKRAAAQIAPAKFETAFQLSWGYVASARES